MSDETKSAAEAATAAMKSEAEARLAALDAKNGAGKAPSVEVKVEEKPAEATEKASPPVGAEKPAEATKAVDVEWLPENLRDKATALDPDLAKFLKANVSRRSAHERAMKALDDEKKQIESIKQKAGLWERLEANPRAADAAYKALNGQSDSSQEEEEIPDPVVDPKGYAKWIVGQTVAATKKAASEVVDERVVRPASAEAAVRSAAAAWAEDNHITDQATMDAVAAAADEIASDLGVRFNPENTPKILSRAMKSLGHKNGASNGKVAEGGGLLKVASPVSRGSTSVAPVGVPEHIRQGKPPSSDEERVAHAAYLARERLGMKVSTEDIRSLFSGRGFASK